MMTIVALTIRSGYRTIIVLVALMTCLGAGCGQDRSSDPLAGQLIALGGGFDRDPEGRITFVNLSSTTVSDDDLEVLTRLPALTNLWLHETTITDGGLVHLKDLKNLEVLVLSQTGITNGGLVHLKGLLNLHEIYLSQTAVTPEGIFKLKAFLPETAIVLRMDE